MLSETMSTDVIQHSSNTNNKKSFMGRCKEVSIIIAVVIVKTVLLLYSIMTENGLISKWLFTKQNNLGYILYRSYDYSATHYYYYRAYEGQTLFLDAKCPVNTCYITKHKDLLPIKEFDVIVFQMDKLIMPNQSFQTSNATQVQQVRSPNQKYVYFLLEPPPYEPKKKDMVKYERYFNWTMTYRLDSDIPSPYGWVVPMNASPLSPPIHNRSWLTPNFEHTNEIAQTAEERPKLVAWLVSHCKTQSKREKYVAALADFIHVDIYGRCGSLSWSHNDIDGFYSMLNKTYKFYLSFENSLCKDYMTEKVFKILQYHVIPVVYGGGDYEHILPPHSVINVKTFASPQELANYMLELSNDPEEYYKYFWWKKYYKIFYKNPQPFCKLCEMVHSNLSSKTYDHLEKWWSGGICQEPLITGH